jgi:hypothetical protein
MAETKTVTIGTSFAAMGDYTSVECRADELEHTFDVSALGEGPAAAIRDAIARGIRSISEPARSGRPLFNRSGHLANGISASAEPDGGWSIAAPPDRLQDPALAERLAELVPAIAKPLDQPPVKSAIEQTTNQIVRVKRR